jgi:hypothetical protein
MLIFNNKHSGVYYTNINKERFSYISKKAPQTWFSCPVHRVELGYNDMKATEYFVSLKTRVILTET